MNGTARTGPRGTRGRLQVERPDLSPRQLFAAVDPERDDDYEGFVATRW
jgi:hypothetical protein